MIRYPLLVLWLLLMAVPAFAENPPTEKLQKIQSELARQKQQAAALEAKAKQASGDLEALRPKLIAATEALQDKQEEQDRLEDRLADLESETALKTAALNANKKHLALLTGTLIRLGEEPPVSYFLRAGMTDAHINRAILLRAILPRLKAEAETAAADLAALQKLREQAAEQKRLISAAREQLEDHRRDLDRLVGERRGLIRKTEAERAAIARRLVSLTSEAKNIGQLFEKVAPRGGGAGPALNSTLIRPTSGAIIRGFGARDSDGVASRGLTFRAAPGAPVVAPLAGHVVFAGPFRGYGQILILQHKGGYHSLLAGFGRIDAEMGQDVAAGEPLGALPAEGGSKPEFYFEWRRNGEPTDPTKGSAFSRPTKAAAKN